ncbi:MAG: hypothetical protein F6K40_15120 [Okeania sp. SIO3I5]|uniref:hypothetical protein n=1 Tax=Okeania sp. SIO3I5 TaxID=2607805 RepID=UPI0013BAB6BD|nr:hypothetical protein [Okeania sp. SIO3I5]NEQ37529.1 hypothetical protein [Okeania sp. SIO3I5]
METKPLQLQEFTESIVTFAGLDSDRSLPISHIKSACFRVLSETGFVGGQR